MSESRTHPVSGPETLLPSWRPGPTRDAIVSFLEATADVAIEDRVACFDNDGTLWCERPHYVQLEFLLDVLRSAVAADPRVADGEEFAALLSGDQEAIGAIGIERIGMALTGLLAGISPEVFRERARAFLARAAHPTLGRRLRECTYQPMLELIEELRARDFSVCIATGGGTDFVRAVSLDLYGVAPEAVVGTLLAYDVVSVADGGPSLVRTARLLGDANEGPAKVTNIQTQLGRRPILAVGNSAGDRDMLAWAANGMGPRLAVLLDHDDDEREFAYQSLAATIADSEPITAVAERAGWTVVSMARDWEQVFATTT
ncbi:haloacid dehalogenase-like hydrolase [Nocardioides sp. BGMRC 2183]|nr:haloacid dehalogenase-like hydrolase [Nocardioides sp. BGMRC 2183]